MQPQPVRYLAELGRVRPVKQVVVYAVVGNVDPRRVSREHAHQLVPGCLGRHDEPGCPARRGADGRLVESGGDGAVRVRLGEEGQVMHGDHDGLVRPQRHRVMRGVDDVRVDLLGHQRQPALLPGQPGWPVRDSRGSRHHPGVWHEPPVSLLICPLAGHRQVGSGRIQRTDQAVYIAAQRTAVGRHRSRVNQHTRCHDQYRSLHSAMPGRAGRP